MLQVIKYAKSVAPTSMHKYKVHSLTTEINNAVQFPSDVNSFVAKEFSAYVFFWKICFIG